MNISVSLQGDDLLLKVLTDLGAAAAAVNGMNATIGSPLDYARYVHEGTGVYAGHSAWDVYGLQAFQAGGATVFATHTHHEGQQPQPFLTDALADQQATIVREVSDAIDAVAGGGSTGLLVDALYRGAVAVQDSAGNRINSITGGLRSSLAVQVNR